MTQIQLAEAAECDQASISRYESGKGIPERLLAQRLAKALKLNVIDILYPPVAPRPARKKSSRRSRKTAA